MRLLSSPVVKTLSSKAGGRSSISGWELRSHMLCGEARKKKALTIFKVVYSEILKNC